MTIVGFSVLDVDPRLVCRDAGAAVWFYDEPLPEARVFLVRRRGEAAACCEVEGEDYRLAKLADAGRLSVAVDVDERSGLAVVSGVRLFEGGYSGCAFVRGRARELMPPAAQEWSTRIAVAAAGGRAEFPMPPATARPRGTGTARLRLVGAIDEKVHGLLSTIRHAGDRDIEIVIDSPGGSCFLGQALYRALVEHPYLVTARILKAESMAVPVALAADWKTAAPDATLLLHRPHVPLLERAEAAALREHADLLDAVEHDIGAIVAVRAGVNLETAASWIAGETEFGAGEAVQVGLVDAIDFDVPPARLPKARARTQAIAAPFSSFRASPLRM